MSNSNDGTAAMEHEQETAGTTSTSITTRKRTRRQVNEDDNVDRSEDRGGPKRSKAKDQSTWMSYYNKLIEYKQTHGNCEVPQRYNKDPAFGKWVKSQREYYKSYTSKKKNSSLTEERVALLNDLQFEWVSTKTKRTVMKEFPVHLAELKAYKEVNGHTRVPHVHEQNPGLGVFCHRCKIYFREMQEGKRKAPNDWLTEERIQALDDLQFEWKVGRWKNALSWEERYAQLVEFKDTFGHCNVTKVYDQLNAPGLKAWVSNQKSYLSRAVKEKKFKSAVAMSEEKIAALKSLGVEFERGDRKNDDESDEQVTGGPGERNETASDEPDEQVTGGPKVEV